MPANGAWRQGVHMKLAGQVAIITGAGRNIGEDTAKLFATEGAKVAVVDNHQGRADKVAGDIVKSNGEAAGFVADVSSRPTSKSWSRTSPPSGARSTS